jgi:hypothetical protein
MAVSGVGVIRRIEPAVLIFFCKSPMVVIKKGRRTILLKGGGQR